jgi:hypothetical protein
MQSTTHTAKRTGAVALFALVALMTLAFSPLVAPAGAVPVLPSTCRASVLKVEAGGETVLEPVVQGNNTEQCVTAGKTLIGPIGPIPDNPLLSVGASVAFAKTSVHGPTNPPSVPFHFPKAHARVIDATASVTGVVTIVTEEVDAVAKARCVNGVVELVGRGKVVDLVINGQEIPDIVGPTVISIPPTAPTLAIVKINITESDVANDAVVRTAITLELLDSNVKIILATARAELTNDCSLT